METRDYTFRLNAKSLDANTGTFTGICSAYGDPPDLMGDIIAPGAYKAAIASQGNGYPLLFSHQQDQPIGLAKMSDSPAGLVINGSLLLSDVNGARAYNLLKAGVIKGLSIGYQVDPANVTYSDDGSVRTLKTIRLFECSLVAIPAQPRAQVTSIKSLAQVENVLRNVRPGDVTGDTLDQLRNIGAQLKSLLKKDADDDCSCDCDACIGGDCDACDDDCEECQGGECSGCVAARSKAADLDDLKAFAMELKRLTA